MTAARWALAAVAASLLVSGSSFAPINPQAHKIGLGKVLTTQDGGQIFGFDIDQKGDDGALASAQTIDPAGDTLVSMETFNQNTGVITKSFARHEGKRHSYSFDGIFANDVGLVTHFVTPPNSIYAIRYYDVMNPVTAQEFTGAWTPPRTKR
jgi:hypothetical protein